MYFILGKVALTVNQNQKFGTNQNKKFSTVFLYCQLIIHYLFFLTKLIIHYHLFDFYN